MAKNKFMQGTLILLTTSIILKVLGFLYQIAIIRFVGTEPVGILNMAFPFYIAFVVLATAGIPLAISKIVAAEYIQQNLRVIGQVMKLAFAIVLVLGSGFLVVSILLMPQLFALLGSDRRLVWCFYMLVPGIVIVPVASIIRGYFQGLQQMLYPSLAQLAEQIVRLMGGMMLVVWLKPLGVTYIAMGLAGGMMLGEVAGLLVIGIFYGRFQRKMVPRPGQVGRAWGALLGEMASLGVPTTGTKLTSSLDMALEASLIPFCLLQMGYNYHQAASVYGQFSGVVLTLLTIPMVLTSALSTALVPAISEAAARKQHQDLQNKCSQALRVTYIFSLPVIVVLFLRADQLSSLLFNITGIGNLVKILAMGAIFLYLGQTSVGIMQGLGLTKAVFVNNLVGAVIKLVLIYWFILSDHLGMEGVALAFVLSYTGQCLLNLLAIMRRVKLRLSIGQIFLPMLCCVVMVGFLNLTGGWLASLCRPNMVTLGSVVASGLFYMGGLILLKQFDFKDLR